MATIKFITRAKGENVSLYLKLRSGNTTLVKKTGFKVNSDKWKGNINPHSNDNLDIKTIKATLRKLQDYVFNSFNNLVKENNKMTSEWLTVTVDSFFGRSTLNNSNAIEYINFIIETAPNRPNSAKGLGLTKGRIHSYKTLKKNFKDFQGNKNYNIADLNKTVFDKFKKWLLENNYSPVTIHKRLSDLRTVCRDARRNGLEVSNDIDIIKIDRYSTYDSDDMDVITLTRQEIEQIKQLDLTGEYALDNARKWLILACFTGQRGSDLVNKVIENNFYINKDGNHILRIKQSKGNKFVDIYVLPDVQEILEKGLPYKVSTTNLSLHFKQLGRLAKIDTLVVGRKKVKTENGARGVKAARPKYEYLSTHIGRRTFATLHYEKIPTASIMKVTGHSKESTFLQYINKSESKHIEIFAEYYKNQMKQEKAKQKLKVV